MYLLRRAAVRSFSSQTSAFVFKQRTFVTRTPSTLRSQQSQVSAFQRRFASEEASPTQASTTDETVTTEPSKAEQEAKAEAEAEVAKDEQSTSSDLNTTKPESTVAETAQNVSQTIKETAASTAEAVQQTTRNAATAILGDSAKKIDAGTFGQPKPGKVVYCGNLFFDVKSQDLEREFARFGDVVNCKIAQDAQGLSKGFGYVEFADVDSAAKAIQALDQQVFQGRRMAVQFHVRREPRDTGAKERRSNPPSKTLFIGNMSFQMSDKDLNDVFREIRNVLDVRVAIDRRSGQPRGFAHADFIDVESAEAAKKVLEDKTIFGRRLRVDFSTDSASKRA